jgi:hypothetical protein
LLTKNIVNSFPCNQNRLNTFTLGTLSIGLHWSIKEH